MKDQPLEAEYRFDRVPKPERENCLNWELHREICRGYGQEIPQPWLEMTEKEKEELP